MPFSNTIFCFETLKNIICLYFSPQNPPPAPLFLMSILQSTLRRSSSNHTYFDSTCHSITMTKPKKPNFLQHGFYAVFLFCVSSALSTPQIDACDAPTAYCQIYWSNMASTSCDSSSHTVTAGKYNKTKFLKHLSRSITSC